MHDKASIVHDWRLGAHCLKGKHPNGEKLVCVGYHYFSKKTLFFIMTEGAGCMTPGKPYEMKFVDKYGNIGKIQGNFILFLCDNPYLTMLLSLVSHRNTFS